MEKAFAKLVGSYSGLDASNKPMRDIVTGTGSGQVYIYILLGLLWSSTYSSHICVYILLLRSYDPNNPTDFQVMEVLTGSAGLADFVTTSDVSADLLWDHVCLYLTNGWPMVTSCKSLAKKAAENKDTKSGHRNNPYNQITLITLISWRIDILIA